MTSEARRHEEAEPAQTARHRVGRRRHRPLISAQQIDIPRDNPIDARVVAAVGSGSVKHSKIHTELAREGLQGTREVLGRMVDQQQRPDRFAGHSRALTTRDA